jgi:hypothetical protein
VPLPAAACSRDGSQRLQDWFVQLLRVEAEPGRVSFHDGDASNEVFAVLAFLLEFCCKVTNSIRVELLLDGRARKPHILWLVLFGCFAPCASKSHHQKNHQAIISEAQNWTR